MRYLLPELDIERFRHLDDLVRLNYQHHITGKWGFPHTYLSQIGTTFVGLSDDDVEYIESNNSATDQLNGVCFHAGQEAFKIWMNPELAPDSLLFEMTILHELCHGYLGPGTMHNRLWRRYYGVVLSMYSALVNPKLLDVDWQVRHIIRRYRTEDIPNEDYGVFDDACNFEVKAVKRRVESNINRVRMDLKALAEMRKGCLASTSSSTPTPAYLASLPRKAGMESL